MGIDTIVWFGFVLRFKKRVSLIYRETDVQPLIYKQESCVNDRMMGRKEAIPAQQLSSGFFPKSEMQ